MAVRVCNDKVELCGVDISRYVAGYEIQCKVGSVTVVELTLIRPDDELKINGRTLTEMFAPNKVAATITD